ncbi:MULTISPECIES: DUF202 domain-containing protein [unclassified Vibrio]|uniref:DUF202 domain-containing protein n=1 Tax=unclassified Vibrio TaxID=2614977 RepID=UPI00355306A8
MLDSGLQLERTVLAWIRTLLLLIVNIVLVARGLVVDTFNLFTALGIVTAIWVSLLSFSLLRNFNSGARRNSTHFLFVSLLSLTLVGLYWIRRICVIMQI